ncbi:thyroid receptor-interacting protein 11-like [Colias croceus]|uniref:thyroid receptor-interacting protein 11-like n=1 Tax=Colias crocea TaxID=72248 RepID=UPI001E27A72C|nr:thyroid receptor-interacting protein 11-like [Colias croceus]
MSWLNLNQSLSSLKGQITNFATEVLAEGVSVNNDEEPSRTDTLTKELEEKCHNQELEIASLKKINEELQASLQSERLSKRNGVKEDESSWYWDPPPQSSKTIDHDIEKQYKLQIQALQDEISAIKDCSTVEKGSDNDEELHRLREENKNLANSLEDLDSQHQAAMEKLLTLKKELQKNFELLKQEHEDMKNANDDYSAEVKQLMAKLGERDEEIERMKTSHEDYETLQHKYQNLERIHSLLRENAEKFQEENQKLHEEVFKLQEQVTELEHAIEIATKESEMSDMVPKEKYEELQKKINELQERRNTNQIHMDEINIDDNAKSVIETLKRDINDLKHKLEQKESDDTNTNKTIKPEKIMQLYNRYVNFDLPVDYVGEIPSSTDNIVLFKLESVFKTINSFKKDIDTFEQKLSEKKLNISHLKTQIEDLTTENEYLTTDIQHFESELDEMKKNNDFLISEIAALKNTSKLEPIIESHEDNLVKLESELADCNKMNKTFESEIKRIETELSEVRKEKIILQESLNDLRKKYTTMLNELETCKNETKAVEELENTANVTQNEKLIKACDDIDDLRKRLSNASSKNEQLSIDLHIIENDKVLLLKEIDELKVLLSEKSSSHKELESLKAVLDHKLKDVEIKLDALLKHKQEIENDNFNLTEKVKTLEATLKSQDEIDTIIKEKTEVLARLEVLQNENTDLSKNVNDLNNEISNLRREREDLINDNNSLKQNHFSESEIISDLKDKINELKIKVDEFDALNIQFVALKSEHQIVLEKKLRLEAELSKTDAKILHFESEFDKLITDLNEKDSIIDTLNSTLAQNNITVTNLNQSVSELQSNLSVKNEEIERLQKSLQEVTEKLNSTSISSNHSHEELQKLHSEKEEVNKQLYALNDEIVLKNAEISKLTNKLEEIEKTNSDYKFSIEGKDKEIKELQQSIVELTDKINTVSTPIQNNDSGKLLEEKNAIEQELNDLKNNLTLKESELLETKNKSQFFENQCKEYQAIIDKENTEKAELINLVSLKHNESLQYHGEIQRLNRVILEQTNEFKRMLDEKDALIRNHSDSCLNCDKLIVTIKEKDEIIMSLNQNLTDHETLRAELINAKDTVVNLTKKCEDLDKSLTIQLEIVKKLTAENLQLSEKEQNSTRELERLRHHLVETEENYTQELMTSEQKLTECQTRLHQVEERAKQTSTVYTSNSIRANQEVETLRNQIKLLEKQREDGQARLGEAEDARSRSEAALTNLQVVLEQFQLDKERDIHAATEKIRNKMEDIKRQNLGLQDEIARLKGKLEESIAGLQAATRLGDQVETKTAQINDLKEQVRTLQTSVAAAEERYYNAISNQQDRVDKNLVKNLVVNYVLTAGQSSTNRTQILRILSTVLDFNQKECEKLGLARSTNTTDSLAAEFVKFLQTESTPRPALPDMMGLRAGSRKSSTVGPHPTLDPGHRRNPSTGSNNLLFQNLDSMETASQKSTESESRIIPINTLETGINQTRNNEGAILKHVLKDM